MLPPLHPSSQLLTALFALLAPLASPTTAAAQDDGQNWKTIHEWHGTALRDKFGTSVSNAGDINSDGFEDVIVGAPRANVDGHIDPGTAIVYSGADGSILHQWFGATSSSNSHHFGQAVSGAGDVNADGIPDLIVGATTSEPTNKKGHAYVYSGADGSELYHFTEDKAFNFGGAVSGAGDVDADGFDDVIVGSSYKYIKTGFAIVYSGATGLPIHSWNGSHRKQYFGATVCEAGDINHDGYDDVIIGAPGSKISIAGVPHYGIGKVFAYSGRTGEVLMEWHGLESRARFGHIMARVGDVNADGFQDLIIGTTRKPGAFVYSGFDGTLLQELSKKNYIFSVSGAGDVDHDGFDDLAIGMRNESLPNKVGIFSGSDGSLLGEIHGTSATDSFGYYICGGADINADGHPDIIVGAPNMDIGTKRDAGGVAVYSFDTFIHANSSSLSNSTGGTINFEINFPDKYGQQRYMLLLSAWGTGPTNYGVDIPLTWETMMMNSVLGIYPGSDHNNLHGNLNINGDASGSLTIPAGSASFYVGFPIHFAAITLEHGRLPNASSIALPVTIMP